MPAPAAAAVAVRYGVRRRRQLAALAGAAVAGSWLVAMSVVVVAMDAAPDIAALGEATGIPAPVLAAYQDAADSPTGRRCGLRWQVLAGVARVESDHAADSAITDAAHAAAGHLCARGGDLRDDTALRDALFAYNPSPSYVADVVAWIRYYDQTAQAGGDDAVPTGTLVTVGGITVDASIADNVEALLAAAQDDGHDLGGSGYRSHHDQITLRRAQCGTSRYAVYDMAPSACSPPTARPGESRHEAGLAIDFTCGGALITSRTHPCHRWLVDHAPTYGLRPLHAEPWHWSVDGR